MLTVQTKNPLFLVSYTLFFNLYIACNKNFCCRSRCPKETCCIVEMGVETRVEMKEDRVRCVVVRCNNGGKAGCEVGGSHFVRITNDLG